MMRKFRIALQKARLLATVGSAAMALWVLMPGTSAAFSVGSLNSSYGCIGRATINDNSGTLSGISELLRLAFNGAGKVNGRIVLNLGGTVCNISATGTYNVSGGGVGSMKLLWSSATGDEDGDTACSVLNAQAITQHTDLVLEAGGNAFDFQAQDDFLTSPTTTTDDDIASPFVGTCRKQ
jgi:hypothetical protein